MCLRAELRLPACPACLPLPLAVVACSCLPCRRAPAPLGAARRLGHLGGVVLADFGPSLACLLPASPGGGAEKRKGNYLGSPIAARQEQASLGP